MIRSQRGTVIEDQSRRFSGKVRLGLVMGLLSAMGVFGGCVNMRYIL